MTRLIYEGKTKDVYENSNGSYTLKFKDMATGRDGVFDPGENRAEICIDGLGRASLLMSVYYFEIFKAAGISTHYIDCDINSGTMQVLPARMFGKGVEFICRCRADGSFLRRYGAYISSGAPLHYLVETTLKDDERQDPPITKETLAQLGIMSVTDFDICVALTEKITKIIEEDLREKGFELYDIKYEFGMSKDKGDVVMLVDEISAGSMRVYKDGKLVPPMELCSVIIR